jgi:hypothetical protein
MRIVFKDKRIYGYVSRISVKLMNTDEGYAALIDT